MIGSNAIGNSKTLDIDLFIFGRFDDKMNPSTLASAGPRYSVPETGQPLVGVVNINTNVNYSKINSKEYFQSIIIHEFTHILGFLNNHFKNYFKNIYNIIDDYGLQRYFINSTKVLEVARKYFNCPNMKGVELEESGDSGTAGSHWEARILLGEYMIGVLYPEEQVISEFTLALLEDSGYYKANYYTGGLMRYGKGKGCDFINSRCVNSTHEINPFFENEFYDSIKSPYLVDASCTSGRQSRAYHAWWVYDNLPNYYKYFENEKYGGFSPADYCPVSQALSTESENTYYTGHCSLKGNGGYGTKIIYQTKKTIRLNEAYSYFNTSEELYSITGETYSDHSFCYQSSLIKHNVDFNSEIFRAICYESFCSDYSLTVKINEDYIVCPRAGGKIEVEGYNGSFLCPDYNLICSGTVICNDMFDCVDKKSQVKENSYIYDYTIKTSQNLENAEIEYPDNITNYELGDNGICPKYCEHCHENKICLKCRKDFNLVGSKENQEIKCLPENEISKEYYIDNGIYYSCIKNCEECSNGSSCDKCFEGFEKYNDKCIKKIDNCQEYGDDEFCSKCVINFAFKGNDKTVCYSKDNFNNYYTLDNGISYYLCEMNISG